MKILHVYKDYDPIVGGIENHMKTLSEAMVAQGHEVQVLVTNPASLPAMETINGVQVHRVHRLATVASTPLSLALPLALRRFTPDITHLHFPYPIGEVSQWLMGGKRPFVITYHSDVVKQKAILAFYKPLLKRVLQKANAILPTSDRYIQSSPYLRPLADKCHVVPLSVDMERFEQAPPLYPKTDVPTIVFVGLHRYYKGLDDLIKAMPQLNARLLVAGSGPMTAVWQTLAQELKLGHKVQFVGRVPDADLPAFYKSGDIFVLPANARSEAFGKVLLEAMAAGLPCVTTEVGTGTSYVVQHEITGLIVPPKSPVKLGEAIYQLLQNKSYRQQLGQAGQDRARQEFTVARMVERVTAIYKQILEN